MPSNISHFPRLSFHRFDNGREIVLTTTSEVGTDDMLIKIPIPSDLLFGAQPTEDDGSGFKSVTVLTREEYAKDLSDKLAEWLKDWQGNEHERFRFVIDGNPYTYQQGNGYLKQIKTAIDEAIEDYNSKISQLNEKLNQELNKVRVGSDANSDGWNQSSMNLKTLYERLSRAEGGSSSPNGSYNYSTMNAYNQDQRLNDHDSRLNRLNTWLSNMSTYNLPVGSIVPVLSVSGYSSSYFSRCWVKMGGQEAYSVTYPELIQVYSDLSDGQLKFVPDSYNITNMDQAYQEMMSSTASAYTTNSNTPTRVFMSLEDLCKFLGGSTSRASLRNRDGQSYKVAHGGNKEIIKNVISEYYIPKYGNDSNYGYKQEINLGRDINNVSLSIDSKGLLGYKKNNDLTYSDLNLQNTDLSKGYIQIVTVKAGNIILSEDVYIKRDTGNQIRSTITPKIARLKKDMSTFKSVDEPEEVRSVESIPTVDTTIENLVMPLSNDISPYAGRSITLPNMTEEGIFLGGGGSPGARLEWTIPDFSGHIQIHDGARFGGYSGIFYGKYGRVCEDPGTGTCGEDSVLQYKLSNYNQYQYHTNTSTKSYPNHVQCHWYVKTSSITS